MPLHRSLQSMKPNENDAPSARERLRQCWYCLDQLSKDPREDPDQETRETWISQHRTALDELIAQGELSAQVAHILHEAYRDAANYSIPEKLSLMCYRVVTSPAGPARPNPERLLQETLLLNHFAATGTIDRSTLNKARLAIQTELAFYAPAEDGAQSVMEQLEQLRNAMEMEQYARLFEDMIFRGTPEIKAAAQFLMDLLTRQ